MLDHDSTQYPPHYSPRRAARLELLAHQQDLGRCFDAWKALGSRPWHWQAGAVTVGFFGALGDSTFCAATTALLSETLAEMHALLLVVALFVRVRQ